MIFRCDIAKRSSLCYDEEDNVPAIELELRFFLSRRSRPCEGTGGIGCKSLRVGHCEALPAASPTGRISQIHRVVRCGTCLHRDCLHPEKITLVGSSDALEYEFVDYLSFAWNDIPHYKVTVPAGTKKVQLYGTV